MYKFQLLTHEPVHILQLRWSAGIEIIKNIPEINWAAPQITYTVLHTTCRAVHNLSQPGHITS